MGSYFKDFHASGACLYVTTGWCIHVKRNFNSLLSLVRLKLLSWRIYIQPLMYVICCTPVSAIPWLVKVIFPVLKGEAGKKSYLFVGECWHHSLFWRCLDFIWVFCLVIVVAVLFCFVLFSLPESLFSKGKETKALCYATPSVMGPSLQLSFCMLL